MPLADPTIADVLNAINARLQQLTIEDEDRFSTVASEIVLPSREQDDDGLEAEPERPKDRQVVVSIGGLVRNPEWDCGTSPLKEGWTVEFRIRLRLMPSETDAEELDAKLLRFLRDARKAVCSDAGGNYLTDWYSFGGLAIDSRWGDYERLINDGTSQSDGYVMPLFVDVRINENSL